MDVNPSLEQSRLLNKHLELVIQENKVTNLTRITTWEQGQLLHIEDSLQGLTEIIQAPKGCLIDLGTGGGFPGIPLSIMTGRQTLLVDSVGKKIKALDRIIVELDLIGQIETYAGRAEELAQQEPESAAVITARALSSLPSLLELASPLLQLGGHLVCYKGQPSEEEISHAQELESLLGMRLIQQREFVLSDQVTHRSIIVFEKISQPSVKLPRRVGMAQKKPY